MSDTTRRETLEEPREEAEADEERPVSLRLDGVTKTFADDDGEVVAVDDVTLDIYEGEFVVLVGPSGCGKTTTLRMVAGLEEPTGGRIEIDGEDVAGEDPRERDVAMVFQNYALYPHKTVRENIAFPLRVRKYPDDEVTRRVEETAAMLDIPDLLDRRPSDLSGGQQQRVALGRAVVRDPELFLFDEPLSNLDAKLRIRMRTELNKLHERVGKTSLYVTHDQAEAMTLGDRVAVMHEGRVQQLAPPQTVYERPANRFVAGFIGEPPMNFFDAELTARDGDYRVVADAFDLALPAAVASSLPALDGSRPVEFGVRPEHLADARLGDGGEGGDGATKLDGADGTLEATVRVVEPMGSHTDLVVVPTGGDGAEAEEFTARVEGATPAREGEAVSLRVAMEKVHLFDAATGENLRR